MAASGVDHEQLLRWVERVAMYLERDGVPQVAGRALGWLLVCDPPEQSAGQIGEAIGASRAALATNLPMLTTLGFVTRHARPGERTTYYRVDDNAAAKVVQRQVASLVSFGEITRDGVALLGADSARAARVRQAHEVFQWLAKVFENVPPPPTTGRGD